MLKKNPDERISIAEILTHPWVTKDVVPTLEEVEKDFVEKKQKSKKATKIELKK